jgi:hypothetical protein
MDEWHEELDEDYSRLNYLLDSPHEFDREQIKNDLGINILPNQLRTFKLLVLNFYSSDRKATSFSIGNNPHPIKRYNPHEITYSTLQGVIKKLSEAKLIKFVKGKPSKYRGQGKESTAEPTAKLTKWICNTVFADEVFLNIDTHIRLRDKNKVYDFRETKYTQHVDKVMKRYHKKLKEWDVAIDDVSVEDLHIFVNFQAVQGQTDSKGDYLIRHGGRFVGQWNSIRSAERLHRISFKNVRGQLIEEDYTACGTNALYMWETGKFLDHDPYNQIPYYLWKDTHGVEGTRREEARQFIKRSVNIGINRARHGIQKAYDNKYKHFHDVPRVLDYYKIDNEPIAKWIMNSRTVGRRAMFLESNMVLGVLDRLTKANIPSVTIFDSFIFPKKYEKQVRKVMYQERSLEWLRKLLAKDEQGQLVQP